MSSISELSAFVRQHADRAAKAIGNLVGRVTRLEGAVSVLTGNQRPLSPEEQLDALDGRRIDFVFSGDVTFTAADRGIRGQPVTIQISQDGPFIMTHYPMFNWWPTAPETATNLGRYRPCTSYPLPDQVVDTDIIDLMYEISDGGNGRGFQNNPRGPVFSRPDNIVPLPKINEIPPSAVMTLYPTYNAITWDAATPPTAGNLHIDLIGYRIVNI